MFDRLTEGFGNLFRKISGKGTITESNVREAMQEVRTALLEADVHLSVVDSFCEEVLQDALGRQVTKSLEPGQEMIGIVHRRLVEFLGGVAPSTPGAAESGLPLAPEPGVPHATPGPTIVMMCGLQGSGKTTTCGKLAAYLKKRGRSVMLVAADLQRPAAVEQLQTIAEQVQKEAAGGARVECYAEPEKVGEYGKAVGVAVQVCQRAINAAQKAGIDTVILDTAGRLHVNDELMKELRQVRDFARPHQVYLVVDSMTGQDAVNSARAFHERLEIDGVVLTKFDSDHRGGAALSVKKVTGADIRFLGIGEKFEALEEFHADRVASRILGMGDVVSLVEKAQEQVSEEEAKKLQAKIEKGEMTMEDFLSQLKTLRRMGPLKQLLGLLPGVGAALKDAHVDEKQLDRVEAMINSMTPVERKSPSKIDNSRRRRIAKGSGVQVNDVGQLVKQFQAINTLSRSMSSLSAAEKVAAVKEMSRSGPIVPGMEGLPMIPSRGSTHTPSIKDRFKKRKR